MSQVNVRKKLTFDSSATPKPGAKLKTPKKRAPVDLKKIRTVLSDTVKKMEADDPKKLKAEIARLQKELKKKQKSHEETIDVIKLLGLFNKSNSDKRGGQVRLAVSEINRKDAMSPAVDIVLNKLKSEVTTPLTMAEVKLGQFQPDAHRPIPKTRPRKIDALAALAKKAIAEGGKPVPRKNLSDEMGSPHQLSLGKCERMILNALGSRGQPASKKTVALHAGYSVKSGGFNNSLSKLRKANFVSSNGSGMLEITETGLGWADTSAPVADIEYWKNHKSVGKCSATILGVLEHHGGPMTKHEIAEEANYAVGSGGFNNSLSRLRTLGLIEGKSEISLSEELLGAY
jgi:hypothetical protein